MVPSEVNIIQDPLTPPSPSKPYSSSDPDGSVASLNLTNRSTIRKIDNIIKEINGQDSHNNEQSKKEENMSVITDSGAIDWVYHLDLDHVLWLNQIPTTYNVCLGKKINTLVKVKPNIDYVINYANDLIKRDYCIHVLKEEATNSSSLSSIPESAIASKASTYATIQVANAPPAAKEERESPFIADSTVSETLEAVSMINLMKAAQDFQI